MPNAAEHIFVCQKQSQIVELEQYSNEKAKLHPEYINQNKWISSLKRFIEEKELTKEMLTALIERIEVGFDWNIEIKFRYRDEYEHFIEFTHERGVLLHE